MVHTINSTAISAAQKERPVVINRLLAVLILVSLLGIVRFCPYAGKVFSGINLQLEMVIINDK